MAIGKSASKKMLSAQARVAKSSSKSKTGGKSGEVMTRNAPKSRRKTK